MKSSSIFILAVAIILSLGACNNAPKSKDTDAEKVEESHEGHDHDGHNHDAETVASDSTETTAMLCAGCGQIKGAEKCCVEGAEKCTKCDMDKGSPGCCKITADTQLCGHCGEIAGGEACCKEGATACEGCGLHAGSPGCCKI